ncbi:MAG TPA: hypothetical protein VH595_02980 [Verrucomicrobiae bacterium]|jgi:hypothetical protein|nr:hypothetical protein [Verrucomicrobiae bacterium]
MIKNTEIRFILFLLTSSSLAASPFFPVMPWNSVPNDPAVINKIKECGFTVAGFVSPETLKTCRKAGIKAIVSDPRISDYDWTHLDEKTARAKALPAINAVRKNPALYGYFLRDEPGADCFPGLAIMADLVRQNAPGKWPYINLFPNYASAGQLSDASYEDYLEKFVTTCHPTQLSYDHYALMDNGSLAGAYWNNLEQMRAVALKHGLPFWNIVLAVAHFSFREPSAADLRFEVFSSLAYGARGIAYFTYFAPKIGNYRAAAIDQFGNPTPTWGNLQNVNLQIQQLAPTLLELTSDDTYHFGAIPSGCHGPGTNSLVAGIGGEIAVGDFTHADGTRYVMFVNKNVSKSAPCVPQFRHPPKGVKLISPYTGQAEAFDGEQIWLAPGGGILLKLLEQ